MLEILFLGSTSACFELKNTAPYYAPERYTIALDGADVREAETNVFSIFDLAPGTEHTLRLRAAGLDETLSFRTKEETCAVDVCDFGAAGDGVHDDTEAIRTAIAFLPSGGRLYFPAGTYLTLPQTLKSHMTVEFAAGATLLGSAERERYPIVPGTVRDLNGGAEVHIGGFEGCARPMYQSLLTAEYAEDIAIIGPGTVDGNAQNSDFWTAFREFPTARPRLMFFNRCKNVTVHGVHACNSPSWQLHPYYSENVSFYDLLVTAPKDSPNTDALDPESCDGVNIIGCRFTVGDDCIAIKSGKIELGSTLNRPADHHVIRNCLMEFGHGAVVLGSEIGAGVRNLSVSQCLFRGTDRGLRIKTRRGRGKNCVIDNVSFDNIRMDGVLTPIAVNMWYNCCDPDRESEYVWSREKLPVDERTPHLGSFRFQNLTCTGAEVAACYIDGLPEAPIEAVTLENVSVSFSPEAKPGVPIMENFAKKRCRMGLYLDNVRHIRVDGVTLDGVEGRRLIADHYESVETERFSEDPAYV
ncbi:MAG: glycoside hydrolase family 28 protein [Ruminococcaceae bacterium]|nr:glycoside hydrolase family 28 protein [Oscillospiraceae bacterium]